MNRTRRPLIAGNWKMYKGASDGAVLAAECAKLAKEVPEVDLLICPPFTVLAAAAQIADEEGAPLAIGGQNLHAKKEGAFTGEIAGPMLFESGCRWVILGHSERRQHFGETDELVRDKVIGASAAGLLPVVCVGETLAEREAGETLRVVRRQVEAFAKELARLPQAAAIAYEPVWAIGTGKNAGPSEAEEVHAAIRSWLSSLVPSIAETTRILYGGSLKPENAAGLLACPNVDGGLIGGASLDVGSFGAIARAAQGLAKATA